MESSESLLNLLSKPEPNKKEEISKFTNLINTFKYEQDSIDKKYIDIFNDIIEKRLKLILEPDPDYMYLWKVLQTIRVLSRNKIIQKEMYKESHITMYKLCFERLINVTSKWKIIESMITELMTIIQRYFYYKLEQNEDIQEKYINMIIDSDIIDNIILMYSSENENTVKLLESIFNKESYSILNREMVIQKFIDPKNILTLLTFLENKIGYSRPSSSASNISSISSINTNINTMSMNNKNNIGAFAILDLFIFLIKNEEKFTNGFIELEGYKILFELIQSNYDNEKAKLNAKKALFIIQYLSKKLDNKKFKDIKSFIEFFEYLLENKTNEEDVYIIEMSIRSFYFFASNFELSVITNSKWSKLLFRFLLVLSLKIKDLKDAEEQKKLITTQCYIIRVLRQIYSFERNRNIKGNY